MATPREFGPDLFQPEAIDAGTNAFNAQLKQMMAGAPALNAVEPAVTRAARESGGGAFGPLVLSDMAVARNIPGPGGDLGIRIFAPDNPRGVYLCMHGGGWVLGRAHHSDVRNEAIARTCGVAVISVDYRLAPENPYPAGPDDCEAAAVWLAAHAKAEFGTDRLVIGGESAGAHLAVVTLLRLRDRHGFSGFAGANLAFGVYDLAMTPSCARWGDEALILSTPVMQWFFDHFVPAEKRRDPDVSPLYADLRGLPPALFTAGTLDPLLDDSLFMHQRWVAAGNRSDLAVYPGGTHLFDGFPTAMAKEARERIDAFISSCLA